MDDQTPVRMDRYIRTHTHIHIHILYVSHSCSKGPVYFRQSRLPYDTILTLGYCLVLFGLTAWATAIPPPPFLAPFLAPLPFHGHLTGDRLPFSHTFHTLFTHFSHTLHTLFTHSSHTLHTLFTHSSHTLHTLFTVWLGYCLG